MVTPDQADPLRSGFNPPEKEDIYEIYMTATSLKKRQQFCVFFNITPSTLDSWAEPAREMLREDSGLTDAYQSFRTLGGKKYVYAEPGARAWWQLEANKTTDFHFDDRELVLRLSCTDPIMEYFAKLPVSVGWEVDDVDRDGLPVKHYVPSYAMQMAMLRELLRFEAMRMKGENGVCKE